MCFDKSVLQQFIDGEYEGNIEEIEQHLKECETCQRAFEELIETEKVLEQIFDTQKITDEITKTKIESKLFEFYKKEKGSQRMNTKIKKWATIAACISIFIGGMSYGPIRVKATEILSIFRVKEVKGISITKEDITKISNTLERGNGKINIDGLLDLQVSSKEQEITLKDEEITPTIARGYKENAILPKLENQFKYRYMTIYPKSDITFKFDVDKVNEFLAYVGEKTELPKELHQKDFRIHTQKGMSYELIDKNAIKEDKLIWVTQLDSPILELPEGIEQKDIINVLLSLNLLPKNMKTQLASIGDLTTTLPIPYSEEYQTKKDIKIKGTDVILIQSKDQADKFFNAIFKKGETLVNVSGQDYTEKQIIELLEGME